MRVAVRPVVLVVLLILLVGSSQVRVGAEPSDQAVRIRRSVTELGPGERRAFVDAVLALKATPSPYDPGLSWYDQFVEWHASLTRCSLQDPTADQQQLGHVGPMFLPWHRQFLVLFEEALTAVSGSDVAVPYWDWTDPASAAVVFSDDFMGGDGDPAQGYAVTTGPFRRGEWELVVRNRGPLYGAMASRHLVRRFGSYPGVTLPTAADASAALAAPLYDTAPFDDTSAPSLSFRNAIEGWRPPLPVSLHVCLPTNELLTLPIGEIELHNAVHIWVGGITDLSDGAPLLGTMSVPQASPNDPVFFLHHANIDRLWAQWQHTHGTATYLPAQSATGNGADDVVEPFAGAGHPATPATLADTGALGYVYDDAHTWSSPAAAAGGEFGPFDGFCTLPVIAPPR